MDTININIIVGCQETVESKRIKGQIEFDMFFKGLDEK